MTVYTQSPMKDNTQEDSVAYVSGSFLIMNEGPEVVDGPIMMLDASTVENIRILAEDMQPSNTQLATAHFVGQVTTVGNGSGREFGLNVSTYSPKEKTQVCFKVHLHFDDSNHRFDNFRVPRPGLNVNVQAKWKRDSSNHMHWLIENIAYLGAVSLTEGPKASSSKSQTASESVIHGESMATTSGLTEERKNEVMSLHTDEVELELEDDVDCKGKGKSCPKKSK
ncbi:uncharacterized protein EI90DRAFT_3127159 [Cantharellus anzutake]|uniref:uncharacterized protein n=1 Tax=Cantharellus anzutake TaxID=1750568 RepID=UPI0019089723|nr:uncharacterized protein EI90DRAFT_3127159 [Cantharellus anzutake]KAF8327475.1 hypothetical protein EI90DRAFT_3127159 [Cantharellus anzutake]